MGQSCSDSWATPDCKDESGWLLPRSAHPDQPLGVMAADDRLFVSRPCALSNSVHAEAHFPQPCRNQARKRDVHVVCVPVCVHVHERRAVHMNGRCHLAGLCAIPVPDWKDRDQGSVHPGNGRADSYVRRPSFLQRRACPWSRGPPGMQFQSGILGLANPEPMF